MKGVVFALVGVIIGAAAMLVVGWYIMPGLMIQVDRSDLPFDQTVEAIRNAAMTEAWQIPKVYNIQESLINAGQEDIGPLKVISMCKPEYASGILAFDDNKSVAAMMPCRIAVYQTADSQVYISRVNLGMMSRMFGGTVEVIMSEVAAEEQQMLQGIIATENK
jgi:uncharacterized protein (DUF302 family)